MSLRSMTGYGSAEVSAGGTELEVELSSVNRKQFEVRVSLSPSYVVLEPRVRKLIHDAVSRGNVTCVVRFGTSKDAGWKTFSVDSETAREQILQLRKVAQKMGLKDDFTAESLLRLPDVLRPLKNSREPDKIWLLLRKALIEAIGKLVEMRDREGMVLEIDLTRRLGKLKQCLETIKKRAPRVVGRYQERLRAKLKKVGVKWSDNDRELSKEIVILADRLDISEEIVRLDSHFKQASDLMSAGKSPGRALDFLCQEMFREINTIGSKANDAGVSKCVVTFKTELESAREQIQNVE